MTAHLPECPCSNEDHAHVLAWGAHPDPDDCLLCFCPALRACTVRVRVEAREAVAAEAVHPWPDQNEFDVAYIAGHEDQMRDVLAAIDRLAQEAP